MAAPAVRRTLDQLFTDAAFIPDPPQISKLGRLQITDPTASTSTRSTSRQRTRSTARTPQLRSQDVVQRHPLPHCAPWPRFSDEFLDVTNELRQHQLDGTPVTSAANTTFTPLANTSEEMISLIRALRMCMHGGSAQQEAVIDTAIAAVRTGLRDLSQCYTRRPTSTSTTAPNLPLAADITYRGRIPQRSTLSANTHFIPDGQFILKVKWPPLSKDTTLLVIENKRYRVLPVHSPLGDIDPSAYTDHPRVTSFNDFITYAARELTQIYSNMKEFGVIYGVLSSWIVTYLCKRVFDRNGNETLLISPAIISPFVDLTDASIQFASSSIRSRRNMVFVNLLSSIIFLLHRILMDPAAATTEPAKRRDDQKAVDNDGDRDDGDHKDDDDEGSRRRKRRRDEDDQEKKSKKKKKVAGDRESKRTLRRGRHSVPTRTVDISGVPCTLDSVTAISIVRHNNIWTVLRQYGVYPAHRTFRGDYRSLIETLDLQQGILHPLIVECPVPIHLVFDAPTSEVQMDISPARESKRKTSTSRSHCTPSSPTRSKRSSSMSTPSTAHSHSSSSSSWSWSSSADSSRWSVPISSHLCRHIVIKYGSVEPNDDGIATVDEVLDEADVYELALRLSAASNDVSLLRAICMPLAAGYQEDGQFLLALPLLGPSLREVWEHYGAVPENLMISARAALNAFHAAGFVHHDVHLANFCLLPYDDYCMTDETYLSSSASRRKSWWPARDDVVKLCDHFSHYRVVLIDLGFAEYFVPEDRGRSCYVRPVNKESDRFTDMSRQTGLISANSEYQ